MRTFGVVACQLVFMLVLLPGGATAQYLRGVNLAGAEFAEDLIPGLMGENYTYNSEASYRYFTEKGLSLFRVPIRWERIQPELFGPLDPANLQALKQNVAWAKATGGQVIIDIHNHGRYKIQEGDELNTYIIDNVYNGEIKVPRGALTDLWVRLSAEFKLEPAVYAYDIMNEPHRMGTANWKLISQEVLSGIRAAGDSKLILIPGISWSSAERWEQVHGPDAWITDPADNFMYQAHQYFDSDATGTYQNSYDVEAGIIPNLPTSGAERLQPFVTWCTRNQVRGFMGEFGVPNNDPRWLVVLDNFLTAVDQAGFGATYWAAGEWWRDYELSVQPLGDFDTDRPQLEILLKHLGKKPERTVTTTSAAGLSGSEVAIGSLATAYGYELSLDVARATSMPLPGSLSDVVVTIEDSNEQVLTAPLVFVSPDQINYLVPPGLAPGDATITVMRGDFLAGRGDIRLARIAPALFSANGDGRGVAAAYVLRVRADGTRETEAVARFDGALALYVPAPIDTNPSDRLYLEVYGTGFGAATLDDAHLHLGETELPLLYIGPQRDFPGLDQLTAALPAFPPNAGTMALRLTAGGKESNTVGVVLQ